MITRVCVDERYPTLHVDKDYGDEVDLPQELIENLEAAHVALANAEKAIMAHLSKEQIERL